MELRDEGDKPVVQLYATSSQFSFINSGRLGIREKSPLAVFSLGNAVSLTNNAISFIAQNLTILGSSLGDVVRPFEFRGLSSIENDNRLLLMNYRREAGSDWQTSGWRFQGAVDHSFTTPADGRTYLEFYYGNGGQLYLGTAGVDRLRIDSDGISARSHKVIDVAEPTFDKDAATKNYVDSQTGGPKTAKIWGEGRMNTGTLNSAGECTVATVKVSRSSSNASWDGAAAACPQGWWVCSVADRGSGVCGSGEYRRINCDPTADIDELTTPFTANGWVADASVLGQRYQGRQIDYAGTASNESICSVQPVWCCAK